MNVSSSFGLLIIAFIFSFSGFSQYDSNPDSIRIEFQGKVTCSDSIFRTITVRLVQNQKELVRTENDAYGKYQLECGIKADSSFQLYFSREGMLEKWINFDFQSDSMEFPPGNYRPVRQLDIVMIPLSTIIPFQSIEVARFDCDELTQAPRLNSLFVSIQKKKLNKYLEAIKAEENLVPTEE